jgi:BMFP domain-containing protein YqiC
MQTKNPLADEMAKAFETAIGLAQAGAEEAKAAMRAQGDRLAAQLDLVRRDELEAVRDTLMAEIASLKAEVARITTSEGTARPTDDAG